MAMRIQWRCVGIRSARSTARSHRPDAAGTSGCLAGEQGCRPFPRSRSLQWQQCASASLRTVSLDEGRTLSAQSKCQRRYSLNTVRLRPGMPFGFRSETVFTFALILPRVKHDDAFVNLPIFPPVTKLPNRPGTLWLQPRYEPPGCVRRPSAHKHPILEGLPLAPKSPTNLFATPELI